MDRAQFRIIENDCRDLPDMDKDRVSFMDGNRVEIDFGDVKPGRVSSIYRDELGWVACVRTQHSFTLDTEFPTLRQALDFAMEKR